MTTGNRKGLEIGKIVKTNEAKVVVQKKDYRIRIDTPTCEPIPNIVRRSEIETEMLRLFHVFFLRIDFIWIIRKV